MQDKIDPRTTSNVTMLTLQVGFTFVGCHRNQLPRYKWWSYLQPQLVAIFFIVNVILLAIAIFYCWYTSRLPLWIASFSFVEKMWQKMQKKYSISKIYKYSDTTTMEKCFIMELTPNLNWITRRMIIMIFADKIKCKLNVQIDKPL